MSSILAKNIHFSMSNTNAAIHSAGHKLDSRAVPTLAAARRRPALVSHLSLHRCSALHVARTPSVRDRVGAPQSRARPPDWQRCFRRRRAIDDSTSPTPASSEWLLELLFRSVRPLALLACRSRRCRPARRRRPARLRPQPRLTLSWWTATQSQLRTA